MSYKVPCVVVTHPRPDFDEVLAYWMVRQYGGRTFPALDTANARLEFWCPAGRYESSLRCAFIEIGVGGGDYDEHPKNGDTSLSKECAATLIAKALCVDRLQEIYPLLKYARAADTEGDAGMFELSAILKVMYKTCEDPRQAIDFCLEAITHLVNRQRMILEHDRRPLNVMRSDVITNASGREIRLGQICDAFGLSRDARKRFDVVIVNRPAEAHLGRLQIFVTNHGEEVLPNLAPVVALLRKAEHVKRNPDKLLPLSVEDLLDAPGTLQEVPQWHYFPATQAVSNGGERHPYVMPTALENWEIWENVWLGIVSS